MQDDQFYALQEDYKKGKVTSEEVLEEICRHTKNYTVATADFAIIVNDRPMTKAERLKIKEILDAKNSKRSSGVNK